MNASIPSGQEPAQPPVKPKPNLAGALGGFWRLTWCSRLTWRQSPVLLATIGTLPLLAFLVIVRNPRFLAVHNPEQGLTKFYYWWITFYLLVALPLYCLTVFGDLIRDDLQANTLSFLLTRPWTRARLFLAKFLTQLAWTQILALSSGLLLLAVGLVSRIPGILILTPLFLVTVMLVVLVFGALSALIGLLHRRYLVIGAIYGLVIEVGIAQIPSNINTLSMTRHLRTLLGLNPRFQELFGWSSQGALFSLTVILIATVVFLGLATCLFNWVEYHHSEEMRK